MTEQEVAAILSSKIYENIETGDIFGPSNRFKVAQRSDSSLSSGYYGAIILDTQTNTSWLVNRGTEILFKPDISDVIADVQIATATFPSAQFDDARALLQSYNSNSSNPPVTRTTGQSLGAFLSTAVGIAKDLTVYGFVRALRRDEAIRKDKWVSIEAVCVWQSRDCHNGV